MLVVGEPKSVQLACDRIVTTIYTAADTSLDITQRVLIPDAASSLIIGHADGNRLGDLREEAGIASIQVCVLYRFRGYGLQFKYSIQVVCSLVLDTTIVSRGWYMGLHAVT